MVELNKRVNQQNGKIVQKIADQISSIIDNAMEEQEIVKRHLATLKEEEEEGIRMAEEEHQR